MLIECKNMFTYRRTELLRWKYEWLLNLPEWSERKETYKNSLIKPLRCQRCGKINQLWHVHHEPPWRRSWELLPWEVLDSGLRLLCEDCHAVIHKKKRKIDRQLNFFEKTTPDIRTQLHTVSDGQYDVRTVAVWVDEPCDPILRKHLAKYLFAADD